MAIAEDAIDAEDCAGKIGFRRSGIRRGDIARQIVPIGEAQGRLPLDAVVVIGNRRPNERYFAGGPGDRLDDRRIDGGYHFADHAIAFAEDDPPSVRRAIEVINERIFAPQDLRLVLRRS